MDRPNIIYLHTHDMGRYCQPYGHAIPTPNMQRLAEEGVLFRQMFSAAPTCSPARAALLTGQWPHSCGMTGLAHLGFKLNDYSQHILHTLRGAGYYSALFGVQHVAMPTTDIGYDEIAHNHDEVGIGEAAARWLADPPSQPFFASIGFYQTHRPFRSPGAGEDSRYCRPPDPIPDTAESRRDMAGFIAEARALDEEYGMILDALDSTGLAKNTLVICTTDHGAAFPGMKCNLNDQGIGVAGILRGPGGFDGGKVIDSMVSQIDLFPTICDLLDIDPPAWLQGKSIMPLVRGETDEVNEEIFAEVNYHVPYEPMRCVRTTRWKYIKRFDGRGTPFLANCDDGPSKQVWLDAGWRDRPVEPEQLYDLIFDPGEGHNLASDPAHAETLAEMRGRLERWQRATADPLLDPGFMPVPSGALGGDPDDLSPYQEKRPLNPRTRRPD